MSNQSNDLPANPPELKYRAILLQWGRRLDGNGIDMCAAWSEHSSVENAIEFLKAVTAPAAAWQAGVFDTRGFLYYELKMPPLAETRYDPPRCGDWGWWKGSEGPCVMVILKSRWDNLDPPARKDWPNEVIELPELLWMELMERLEATTLGRLGFIQKSTSNSVGKPNLSLFNQMRHQIVFIPAESGTFKERNVEPTE